MKEKVEYNSLLAIDAFYVLHGWQEKLQAEVGIFGEFPLTWGYSLSTLGFFNRNEFISGGLNPENPLLNALMSIVKYAHAYS